VAMAPLGPQDSPACLLDGWLGVLWAVADPLEPAMAGFHALAVGAFDSDAVSQFCCVQTLAVCLLSMAQGPLLLWEGGNTKGLSKMQAGLGSLKCRSLLKHPNKFPTKQQYDQLRSQRYICDRHSDEDIKRILQ
jgi:hypothetical protein